MKTIITGLLAGALLVGCATSKSANSGRWVSLFDGKTLNGWRAAENPATFSVQNGELLVHGPRAHLFYDGPVGNHDLRNFEWRLKVKTEPGANSGLFVHTAYQEKSWPLQGYEIQVNQTHTDWRKTGSVYSFQDVKDTFVKDGEWYTQHITVQGKTVTVRVNDKIINQYTEPDSPERTGDNANRKLGHGTIAIQGHDPKSIVHYKDIELRGLE